MHDSQMVWVVLLEKMLVEVNRPDLESHLYLGACEWEHTAERLGFKSEYWAATFSDIGKTVLLLHELRKEWSCIPLLGYEGLPRAGDIGSLEWRNPAVRALFNRGLRTVGQLFQVDDQGMIMPGRVKSFQELEREFRCQIPMHIRNAIAMMIRQIKVRFRAVLDRNTSHQMMSPTVLLFSREGKICAQVTKLMLEKMRSEWAWGNRLRSHFTYENDGLIDMDSVAFSRSLAYTRRNTLLPSIQWTNIQIFIRSFWTNKKEAGTRRGQLNNTSSLCSNCNLVDETTVHLFYECTLANSVWLELCDIFVRVGRNLDTNNFNIVLSRDLILFNHVQGVTANVFKQVVVEILMITKHMFVRAKYRDNTNYLPTKRFILLTTALEIEKAILTRKRNGVGSAAMESILAEINARVGRGN